MSVERRPLGREAVPANEWSDIDPETYEWSITLFRMIKRLLKVNIKLYAADQIRRGDIFLFNHFSRFETFIPQYLIHEETGAYSCAIASAEFFREDNALSRYLKKVGVIPHNHPRLLPWLSEQIMRGRKVIIFPEGGMVKDRRVLDHQGHYSIYSRITGERRKHHTGPAVLAQGLETFKATVRNAYCAKDLAQLERWQEELGLDSMERLLASALRPTLIVPANITFYPMRSANNILAQAAQWFSRGLSLRQIEELKIEGNILFEDTDMDLRMGKPIDAYRTWHWWNRYLLEPVSAEFRNLDDIFKLYASSHGLKQKILRFYFRKNADATRNEYMEQIYSHVTVNLSHLASTLIMACVAQKQAKIGKYCFYTTLYIAVKRLQAIPEINLHRSLLNPGDYENLHRGRGKRFEYFISSALQAGLLAEDDENYHFLPKLSQEYSFDSVRMENPVAVYNNEAAPIKQVRDIVEEAMEECRRIAPRTIARWRLDDERLVLEWAKQYYSRPKFSDINEQETAEENPAPFFLEPAWPNGLGVLLVHGLLASPAELRSYGEYLCGRGYTVLGIRLRGHGTSPHDLLRQTFEDWTDSVKTGYDILTAFCPKIFVVGFSTGGALALTLAAGETSAILGAVSAATPIKFNNPALMLIPLLHGSNKLLDWASGSEGVKPFFENVSEHPRVNYRHVPVRSIYELRRLIQKLEDTAAQIECPVLLLHADRDPVVAPKSSAMLLDWLKVRRKRLEYVSSERHGILMDNPDGVWRRIDRFFEETAPMGQIPFAAGDAMAGRELAPYCYAGRERSAAQCEDSSLRSPDSAALHPGYAGTRAKSI
jgi:esterase/lipase